MSTPARGVAVALAVATFCGIPASVGADPNAAIDSALAAQREARAAQQRIEQIDDRRRDALEELRLIEAHGAAAATRNRELRDHLAQQSQLLTTLDADLQAIDGATGGIVPLLASMTDALARFIDLDLPFERRQRQVRLHAIRSSLDDAGLDIAERYRRVLRGYLQEIGYGDTTGIETVLLETAAGPRLVEVLRIGRAGLWYVSRDDRHAGMWDRETGSWHALGAADTRRIRRAIRELSGSRPAGVTPLPVHLPAVRP